HVVRQHRARSDRADAHFVARTLRSRRLGPAPILGVLETYPARRFRTLDVGLPDTGLDADRPGVALDRWIIGGLDHRHLGARQLAGRARRLLSEKPRHKIEGSGRDGPASDPLLHS